VGIFFSSANGFASSGTELGGGMGGGAVLADVTDVPVGAAAAAEAVDDAGEAAGVGAADDGPMVIEIGAGGVAAGVCPRAMGISKLAVTAQMTVNNFLIVQDARFILILIVSARATSASKSSSNRPFWTWLSTGHSIITH